MRSPGLTMCSMSRHLSRQSTQKRRRTGPSGARWNASRAQGRARRGREAGSHDVLNLGDHFGRGVREKPFTEADWTDESNRDDTSAYGRSKTIAERAAWAWHKAEGGALELVTVNPSLVLGPVLWDGLLRFDWGDQDAANGSIPALPRFGFNLVDVRDIAALQLLAMTKPSAAGQRFIGSCDFYWMADIAKILKQGLGDKARKVPSFPVPDFLVRVIAIFDPVARGRLYELGKRRQVSSEKARRMLATTSSTLKPAARACAA